MFPALQWIFILATTIIVLCFCQLTNSIVNPNQESANSVISNSRKSTKLGPSTWKSGIECIDHFTKIFFYRLEKLTRSYNMVVTSSFNMSTPAHQIQDGYLKLINEAVSEHPTNRDLYQLRVINDKKPYSPVRNSYGELIYSDGYVFVIDNVARLTRLMEDYISLMISWNPSARFLVLYNNAHSRDAEEVSAMEIFNEMKDKYYVHRVGILYATSDMDYSFLVMDDYSDEACRTMRLKRMGSCRAGQPHPSFDVVNEMMIKFLSDFNLKNCTFFLCASIAAPFVEEDCVTGIEMHLVSVVENKLHCYISQTCSDENRGLLEPNGTWTGLLGELNDRQCDFILGGFYPDNEVTESFWATDCYLHDTHTWFVKLADPRPPWIALYAIFKNETWLCFLGVLIVSWLVWYLFENMLPEPAKQKELSLAAINSMALSICVAIAGQPVCVSSRLFFLVLSLYGLVVTSIYTSQLISVFTDPGYLHQINNLNEVIEAGIPFGGYEESRDWFLNDDDKWIYDRYNYSDLFKPQPDNIKAIVKGERVILSSRMYILQDRLSDDMFAFPKNVFSSPLQIFMKPGFPLLHKFNWIIRIMRDSGLFQKINNDFVYNNTYLNYIAKMRPVFKETNIVLTTAHLQGTFALLIMGLCISIACFLGEYVIYWRCGPFFTKRFGWKIGKNESRERIRYESENKSQNSKG